MEASTQGDESMPENDENDYDDDDESDQCWFVL